MINRLSNPINRNRSAAKIPKVMSSNEEPLACFHANCHHLFHTHDKLVRFLISNPVYGDNDMQAIFFMLSLLIILVMITAMAMIGFHENPCFAEQQTFM